MQFSAMSTAPEHLVEVFQRVDFAEWYVSTWRHFPQQMTDSRPGHERGQCGANLDAIGPFGGGHSSPCLGFLAFTLGTFRSITGDGLLDALLSGASGFGFTAHMVPLLLP